MREHEKTTYSATELPPLKSGTSGHLRPKPEGTTAACVAPVDVDLPYPQNWGKPAGATMKVPAGGWITCLGPEDAYYNAEFEKTSSLTGKVLDPKNDPRARALAAFWSNHRGLAVLIVEAQKTVGVDVLGEVDDEAVGDDLVTPEGPAALAAGDVVVRSVRSGDVYRITPANRKKRYAEDGRVFEGPVPPEHR